MIIGNPNNSTYRGDVSGYLNAWNNGPSRFIGNLLLPALPTMVKKDYFHKREAGQRRKAPDGTRAPGTKSKRDSAGLVQDTYACQQHRLEAAVPIEHSREYSKWGIDWINVRARDKAEELRRGREVRIANKFFNTTTFPLSGTTGLSISDEWDDPVNAIPITDIGVGVSAIFDKCGKVPNALVLADDTALLSLSMCKQLRESLGIRYNDSANMNVGLPSSVLLAALNPALKYLIVGGEVYDSTPNGSASTLTRIWDREYAGLAVISEGGVDVTETCVGRMFTYSDEGGEFEADSYYENDTKQDVVGVQDCTDEKIFLEECFFLFGNVYTA